MTCRRKTKKERELVADIRKLFGLYCGNRECRECDYGDYPDDECIKKYIEDLLDKNKEEE